ncbi:multicopper oxidase family protein [Lacticigenium naphthae]|uniref:multicopper oxidase family protein n=1 Tax=Lacticigenium naphthae TaxID=515351 RepID=UPI0004014E57|nr:multicopper oxidase domain-containing protein [Lacticigenium naphthae]
MRKILIGIALGVLILFGVFFFMGPLGNRSFFNGGDSPMRQQAPPGEVSTPEEGPVQEGNEEALPIPPLMEDTDPDPDKTEWDIVADEGTKEFISGAETDTMGYNGDYLGPTIRVERGQEVTANVKNQLDGEVTTMHWHGLKVDGEDDGGPHGGIQPGETWSPQFTIDQPATTLWYHPHPEERTGYQVYKGLAGLFIIEDEFSQSLDLPKAYGENDIPLVLQDKNFKADGTFEYVLSMPDVMFGVQGETTLVNGTIDPYLTVEKGLMRFRVLNGSNASVFDLQLSNGEAFHQIASDGGFLEEPVEMDQLILGPSERAEILIDFSEMEDGETVTLETSNATFMEFRVDGSKENDFEVPETLVEIEETPVAEVEQTREFVLQGMGPNVNINGKQFDMDRIDEVVELGATEIWEVSNESGMGMMGGTIHPFHIHGTQFQILDRDGNAPPANEQGWKDSFIVQPGETVRVIAQFNHSGLFMYHCHILEHEDAGMMGQFEVVE